MVPDTSVAREAEHRSVRLSTFGSHSRGQSPAERTGAADVDLIGMFQIEHGAGPDTRMARVGDQNRVRGQIVAQFPAEALGPHGHDLRVAEFTDALLPGLDQFPERGRSTPIALRQSRHVQSFSGVNSGRLPADRL